MSIILTGITPTPTKKKGAHVKKIMANTKTEYCDGEGCDERFPLSLLAECINCCQYYCKPCVEGGVLCGCFHSIE